MNKADMDALQEVCKAILEKFHEIEDRLTALEAQQPEPLTYPSIDLGDIGGTGA